MSYHALTYMLERNQRSFIARGTWRVYLCQMTRFPSTLRFRVPDGSKSGRRGMHWLPCLQPSAITFGPAQDRPRDHQLEAVRSSAESLDQYQANGRALQESFRSILPIRATDRGQVCGRSTHPMGKPCGDQNSGLPLR